AAISGVVRDPTSASTPALRTANAPGAMSSNPACGTLSTSGDRHTLPVHTASTRMTSPPTAHVALMPQPSLHDPEHHLRHHPEHHPRLHPEHCPEHHPEHHPAHHPRDQP